MRIRTKNVTKFFKTNKVLDSADFSAGPEKITAIIGPNGAGKTTLLRIIGMLEKPSSGGIFYDDKNGFLLKGNEKLRTRRKITLVSQQPAVFSGSVGYNIRLPLVLRKDKDFAPAVEAARTAGLENLLLSDAKKLSGGEKQRLSVARALAANPDVILFDEPTANLDPLSVKIIEDTMLKLKSAGKTVVLSTHNLSQARKIADDIFFISAGRIIQSGAAEEVFSKPGSNLIAEFTGTQNIFIGFLNEDSTFTAGKISIYAVAGQELIDKARENRAPVKAAATIRPEDILISGEPLRSSARNVLKAKILEVKNAGRIDEIIVNAGGTVFAAIVTKQSTAQMSLKPGKEIYIIFKATSVNIIPA